MIRRKMKSLISGILAMVLAFTAIPMNVQAEEVNLALGKNVTGSSYEAGTNFSPDKVADGNLETRWGTGQNQAAGEWVEIDLSDDKSINRIVINFERTDAQQNILGFHVDLDGTTVYTKSEKAAQVETITFDEAKTASRVKVVIDNADGGSLNWVNVGICEIQVLGEDVAEEPDQEPTEPEVPENVVKTENVNHVSTATMSASSVEENAATLAADKAKDGNVGTWWSSNSATEANPQEWLQAEFGELTQIKHIKVKFHTRNVAPMPNNVSQFTIKYVDKDGAEQTAKANCTLEASGDGYVTEASIVLDNVIVAKAIKLCDFTVKIGTTIYNSVGIEELEAYSNEIASQEPTEPEVPENVVKTENTNHVRTATMAVSSTEANTLGAGNANDGNEGTRWSSRSVTAATNGQEWIKAEFGELTLIKHIKVKFHTRNVDPSPNNVSQFTIKYVDKDGVEQTAKANCALEVSGDGYVTEASIVLDNAIVAKAIKLSDFNVKIGTTQYNSVGITELEAYSNEIQAGAIISLGALVSSLEGMQNNVIENGIFTLPEVPEGYTIALNGADFEQILAKDGTVVQPLTDKVIKVSYEVSDGRETAVTNDITYLVKGKNTQADGMNAKPVVIPEIQEWYSESTEKLSVNAITKVTYSDASLSAIVDEFVADYKDFTGVTLTKEEGAAQAGAYNFTKAAPDALLGEEGYTMNILADRINVESESITGNMYGMQTILQMYKKDATGFNIGEMRDYPRFEVRGFMLDIARKPIGMEIIREIARTMRYYKMNDFQLHLSDNYIFLEDYGCRETENEAFKAYEAYRLESGVTNAAGESPTAKDYYITKEEMRTFIQSQRALGMNIVPEIDLPAHATSFTKIWPELMVQGAAKGNRPLVDHFDVTKPEAVAQIKAIFDDYTTGANPTFDSETTVHVGADEFEYNKTSYRQFFNEIVTHVKKTNPQVRIWGSLSIINDGVTEIIPEAIENVAMNIWNNGWANGLQMYNMGFKLINTLDGPNYMVPDGNMGRGSYGDLLNHTAVFNFEPNKYGNDYIPSSDEQVLGSVYAIWNDNIDKRSSGLTDSDLYWRFFDALPLYAEKNWAATGQEKGSAAAVIELAQNFGTGPRTNPYYQETKDTNDIYESYDFTNGLEDASANNRDLTAATATVENGALKLNGGNSYVKTPIDKLGNGNELSFDITLTKIPAPGDILFETTPEYGTHDIRIMDDGKLGFTRELHDYYFDYELPVDRKVNIRIVAEQQDTTLYVDGVLVGEAIGKFIHNGMEKKTGIAHSTFAIPLERIGSETKAIAAVIDNVVVREVEVEADSYNKAGWTGTTNSETQYNETEGLLRYAFDGKPGTIWHSNWQGVTDKLTGNNSFYAEIDLGQAYQINQFSFTPRTGNASGYVTKADLYVKENAADDWTLVSQDATFAGDNTKKTFYFDTQNVRYVKFVAKQSNDGWVAVSEFDVANIPELMMSVYVEATEGGTATGATEVQSGANVTVQATANTGYSFDGWYNSLGEKVSEDAEYTFAVEKNTALVAKFVEDSGNEEPEEPEEPAEPISDMKDHWSFDTLTSDAGSRTTGVLSGSNVSIADSGSEVFGKVLRFGAGTDNFMKLENYINTGANATSFSMWYRYDTTITEEKPAASAVLLQHEGNGRSILTLQSNGKYHTYLNAANVVSEGTVEKGEWQHITVVFDQTAKKVSYYINGELDSTQDLGSSVVNAMLSLRLGAHKNAGSTDPHPMRGDVDEFYVFEKALSADEAKAVYEVKAVALYKESLETLITEAEELYANGGVNPSHALAVALNNAITAATEVRDKNNATLAELTTAYEALETAMQNYQSSVPVTLTVDVDTVQRTIDSDSIFGINHRYAFNGYGSFDASTMTIKEDFKELYENAGFGSIRYPGGTISNLFNWKSTLGPVENRKDQIHGFYNNAGQGGIAPNFGIGEIATFADSVDSEIVYVYSLGRGSAQDAADLIEYLNAQVGTNPNGGIDWAAVRAENGHPEPYNVRYFEIGNEMNQVYADGTSSQAYWLHGLPNAESGYIEGGTASFTKQYAVCEEDWNAEASKSDGSANMVRYMRYANTNPKMYDEDNNIVDDPGFVAVNKDSVRVYVGDTEWTIVESFDNSGASDQHVVVDYSTGAVKFGDGVKGAIPTSGTQIKVDYTVDRDGFIDISKSMKETTAAINEAEGASKEAYVYTSYETDGFITKMNDLGANEWYDGMTIHPYSGTVGGGSNADTFYDNAMTLAETVGINKVQRFVDRLPEGKVPVISEYGIFRNTEPQLRSQTHAIYIAKTLMEYVRLGSPYIQKHCLIDWYSSGADSLGPTQQAVIQAVPQAGASTKTGEGEFKFFSTPSAHVFQMLNAGFGDDIIEAGFDRVPEMENGVDLLSVLASKDDFGNIYLAIVNVDRENDREIILDVEGLAGCEVSVQKLTSDTITEENSLENPDNVTVTTETFTAVEDQSYTVEKHSIAVLKINTTGKADKNALQDAIEKANSLTAALYKDFTGVQTAVTAGNAVIADEDATAEEIAAAVDAIEKAMKDLSYADGENPDDGEGDKPSTDDSGSTGGSGSTGDSGSTGGSGSTDGSGSTQTPSASQKPATQKPAETKPQQTTPATQKPASQKPATQKPAETKPQQTTPETSTETQEVPVADVVVDTKIVEETASEEVKAAVKETVIVTEEKATVTAETVEKVLETIEKGATVILPLTEAAEEGQTVKEAQVSVKALEKVAKAESALTVEFEGAKVTFEPETLKAITEQAKGGSVELRVVPVEAYEMNEEQQAVLETHDVAARVSAQIYSDGEYIGDFKGGKARIAIPFIPAEGKAVEYHNVYYITDMGDMTLVPSTYADGYMVLETDHFSEYVIVYEGLEVKEESTVAGEVTEDVTEEAPTQEVQEEKAGSPVLPIIIVIAIIAVVGVAYVTVKKKNGEE